MTGNLSLSFSWRDLPALRPAPATRCAFIERRRGSAATGAATTQNLPREFTRGRPRDQAETRYYGASRWRSRGILYLGFGRYNEIKAQPPRRRRPARQLASPEADHRHTKAAGDLVRRTRTSRQTVACAETAGDYGGGVCMVWPVTILSRQGMSPPAYPEVQRMKTHGIQNGEERCTTPKARRYRRIESVGSASTSARLVLTNRTSTPRLADERAQFDSSDGGARLKKRWLTPGPFSARQAQVKVALN